MSKDNKVAEKVNETVVEKDDAEKAKEAIETLRVQLNEHLQKAEHHRTMGTKAQGALEVLLQLYPSQKENNNK